MESDRHLDERLQEAPPPAAGGSPDVLQDLMGLEEAGLVEEGDARPEGGWGHVSILPQSAYWRSMPIRKNILNFIFHKSKLL